MDYLSFLGTNLKEEVVLILLGTFRNSFRIIFIKILLSRSSLICFNI